MEGATPNAANWKVLIVDDQLDNILIAEAALTFFGAEVVTAAGGEEALQIVGTLTPTVVLVDLAMPHMDGYQLHRRLRELPALTQTAIVALTAHAMAADREKVALAGFDAFISKPYDVTQLVHQLEAIIQKRRAK